MNTAIKNRVAFQDRPAWVLGLSAAVMILIWAVPAAMRTPAKTNVLEIKSDPSSDIGGSSTVSLVSEFKKGAAVPDVGTKKALKDEADSQLQVFKDLNEKVLKTPEEIKKFQDLLSDPQMIRKNGSALLEPDTSRKPAIVQAERIDRVEFLIRSIHAEENSARELALETVETVIRDAVPDPKWPEFVRRSWAGDRVELFMALKHKFPEKAAALKERSKSNSQLSKLLTYADGFYDYQAARGVKQ